MLAIKSLFEGIRVFCIGRSDDIGTYGGGVIGYFVGENTEPVFQSANVTTQTSHVIELFWTVITMVIGAVFVFFAKKLAELIWEKIIKKDK